MARCRAGDPFPTSPKLSDVNLLLIILHCFNPTSTWIPSTSVAFSSHPVFFFHSPLEFVTQRWAPFASFLRRCHAGRVVFFFAMYSFIPFSAESLPQHLFFLPGFASLREQLLGNLFSDPQLPMCSISFPSLLSLTEPSLAPVYPRVRPPSAFAQQRDNCSPPSDLGFSSPLQMRPVPFFRIYCSPADHLA